MESRAIARERASSGPHGRVTARLCYLQNSIVAFPEQQVRQSASVCNARITELNVLRSGAKIPHKEKSANTASGTVRTTFAMLSAFSDVHDDQTSPSARIPESFQIHN
jgi:hypothetical protein